MPSVGSMSTPTHRGLIRALDAVKASEGWTDRQLCAAIGIKGPTLCGWRSGRSHIGESNLWKVRTLLGTYARRVAA
jgi:hypothetical protein